jgi:hypothetical protein
VNAGFVDAVGMLPVPRAAGLAPERVDGSRCVWCGQGPAVDLGPRISPVGGTLQRWTPRACRACTGREAVRVHRIHIGTCARCSHRDYCPDGHALHRLGMECR